MKSGHYIPECMDEKMADSVTLLTLAAWSWLSILSLVSWIFFFARITHGTQVYLWLVQRCGI